jgi:hypothetical protein
MEAGMKKQRGEASFGMVAMIVFLISLAGWLTHIVDCLIHQLYVLLLVGVFVFPVGIFHGIGVWFGFWA